MFVGVIALPGCWDSGLTTVLDVLRTAETVRRQLDREIPPLKVGTVGLGSDSVRTAGGLRVPIDIHIEKGLTELPDVLVVPGLYANSAVTMADALARDEVRAARSVLRNWSSEGRELAAACTGTFLLAEAGLLDHQRATTSWWLTGAFRKRYPRVELDVSRMVVRDGLMTTAGAAFAHIDLAMSLVSRVSLQLADATAAHLLIDDRPARSVGAALGYLTSSDQLVIDFETWVRANLGRSFGVADAASALGTTRRTLERRVRLSLNTTPYAVIQRLRAERARHLSWTTGRSLGEVAPLVGYRDASTLRAVLRSQQEADTPRSSEPGVHSEA